LTSDQVTDWLAYDRVEPFGHDNLFLMLGRVCSLIYNANRGKGHSPKQAIDFVPFIKGDPSEKKQSTEGIKALLMAIAEESDPSKRKDRKKKVIGKTKYQKKRERKMKE